MTSWVRGNAETEIRPSEIDLQTFIQVLKKWRVLIVAVTLATIVLVGLVTHYMIKPVYQAKTLLMVTVASEKLQVSSSTVNRTDPTTGTTALMPVLTMNTYLGQLKSEATMKRVVASLGLPETSIGSISKRIEATIVKDSNLIEVKVSHTNPEMALNIANAVSVQYLELMREFMFSSVVVISPANLPVAPVYPSIKLNLIVALMLGLMLSILLAFILDFLDNTIKTVDDVNRVLDLPVLGLIPSKNGQKL